MLGRAQIFFQKSNYTEALKLYKKVLQINPAAPANVRLGFAQCFYQLNRADVRAQSPRRDRFCAALHAILNRGVVVVVCRVPTRAIV